MYYNVLSEGQGTAHMGSDGYMAKSDYFDWTGLGFGDTLSDASSRSASESLDTAAGAISLGPVIAAVIVIGLIVAVIAIFLQLGNSVLGLVQNIAGN